MVQENEGNNTIIAVTPLAVDDSKVEQEVATYPPFRGAKAEDQRVKPMKEENMERRKKISINKLHNIVTHNIPEMENSDKGIVEISKKKDEVMKEIPDSEVTAFKGQKKGKKIVGIHNQ
ncbi:hypothetical protein HAX54_040340 [Datura stramonium]|uniref:Uncharacterized protein n=1 Tax=Datura stramonium TaxID=4076 RepID=A0ABS8VR56_DATST|nr:hypothetical protein [Datura stramonium]